MKYRIDFSNGQHSIFITGSENCKKFLKELKNGTIVEDVRIVYKSGISDSVMDTYKKYIPGRS